MRTTWNWLDKDGEIRVTAESPEGREQALKAGVPFLTKTYGPLREVEVVHEDSGVVVELLGRIRSVESAAQALVDALPRCDRCEHDGRAAAPVTHVDVVDREYCEICAKTPACYPPDPYEYAEPLRALMALLGGSK